MKAGYIFTLLVALSLTSCTTTQTRAFIHHDSSVTDYQWLPSREIRKGSEVRTFEKDLDEKLEKEILAELGFSSKEKMFKKTRSQALIILKGEKILLEEYGAKYNHDSIVTSFSVAKSVNSAMIGHLIWDGKIKSEDDVITDYIPELLERDSRFGEIKIKNLLNMTSGILYLETPNRRMDNTETYYNPDLRKLALTNTLVNEESGKHFLYNNYNPLLLGLIIERVTGDNVCNYLSDSIWSKLGCERDAFWSLDSHEDSFEKMESGINTVAMDFVRFGCLYRDGGVINGKQIIEREWIEKSLFVEPREEEYYSDHWGKDFYKHGVNYGYAWYVMSQGAASEFENETLPDFFAFGNKGQIIYISPASGMVMVRFGEQNIINLWRWIDCFSKISLDYRGK